MIFSKNDIQTSKAYKKIFTIPVDATNIYIRENDIDNVLAVFEAPNHFRLNGRHTIDPKGNYRIRGGKFSYDVWPNGTEVIYIPGPINSKLSIFSYG